MAQLELQMFEDAQSLSTRGQVMAMSRSALMEKVNRLVQSGVMFPYAVRQQLLAKRLCDLAEPLVNGSDDEFEKFVDVCLPYTRNIVSGAADADMPDQEIDELAALLEDPFDPLAPTLMTSCETTEDQCRLFEEALITQLVAPMGEQLKLSKVDYVDQRFFPFKKTKRIGLLAPCVRTYFSRSKANNGSISCELFPKHSKEVDRQISSLVKLEFR